MLAVRQTSKAVIATQWSSATSGISVSTDDGTTFSPVASKVDLGLAFVDDLHGVASGYMSQFYFTSDGGVSWSQSSSNISSEAWGVYGIPCSNTFLAAPEDLGYSALQSKVYVSTDYGVHWSMATTLPFVTTGDVEGWFNTIFVQNTDSTDVVPGGLYRTTDNGTNWRNVGGPSNSMDSRFCIARDGSAIFAFDVTGGVWKTLDGGDGFGLPTPDPLSPKLTAVHFDSVSVCSQFDTTITIRNTVCDSITFTDASLLSADWTLFDASGKPLQFPQIIPPDSVFSFTVRFGPHAFGGTTGTLVLHYTFFNFHGTDSIALDGAGKSAVPAVTLSATSLNLGSGNACATHDTIIIYTNTGCVPVAVTGWSMSQWGNGFNVFGTGYPPPITLQPGQSDSLHITYTSGVGDLYDTVIVWTDADSGKVRRIPVEIHITPVDSVKFVIAMPASIRIDRHFVAPIFPDRIVQGKGLISISGTLSYQNDDFDFEGITAPNTLNLLYNGPNITNGVARIPFSLSNAAGIVLDPATPILQLGLNAVWADSAHFSVTLDSLLLNNSDQNYSRCVLGTIAAIASSNLDAEPCGDEILTGELQGNLVFDAAQPSPDPVTAASNYRATLILQSAVSGTIDIELQDALGRTVSQSSASLHAGEADPCTLDFHNQPAGIYYYTIRFNSSSVTAMKNGKVILTK